MAKVSPVSIKYMIYASFRAEGPLEKPDVIGAIFGQTEGLLGTDLEMRELQKEGRIGRIEVELDMVDGKTVGEIKVPSALDKSETTLIAAALETIDRIGPTEAQIKIKKIEDVRGSKRDFIVNRAKELLGGLDGNEGFEDMSKTLVEESRAAKMQEYGDERLPAGDLSGNEVIVVEGRADVVNLLKNRVNNVIGMNGTKLPREIAKLGQTKELTIFVDGDRGGKLIAKNVIDNANVKYIAFAPDGKEVEELTGKEIIVSLRRKVTRDDFLNRNGFSSYEEPAEEKTAEYSGDAKEKIREMYGRLRGSKMALIMDSNLDVIRKVGAKEVLKGIETSRTKVYAVIIDGNATATIIKVCDQYGVKHLGATNFSAVDGAKVNLISL